MTTPQTPVDALMALVDSYVDEVAEGHIGEEERAAVQAYVRALAAIPAQQAGGVPAGWRKGMEVAASILESNAGPATRKAAADGLRNLLAATTSQSAVQPLSEAQGVVYDEINSPFNACMFRDKCRSMTAALRASSPADTREPLTDEQIEDMHAEANRGMFIERDDYFKAFRDAEFIHGIVTKESSNAS